MTNLQVSYNVDVKKMLEEAKQQKATRENLKLLIGLATITMVGEDSQTAEKDPQTLNDV